MEDDNDRRRLIDQLLTRVDEARDERTSLAEIEDAIRQLEALASREPGTDADYALAYSWYFHPRRRDDETIQQRVSALLLPLTQKNPRDFLAWLYLGHNAYDLMRYDIALGYFRQASLVAPSSYIGLKAHEMVVCCLVTHSGISASLDEMERFVNRAEGYPAEDIWPQQLAAAVGGSCQKLGADEAARLTVLLGRLDRAGRWGSWFQQLLQRQS
ncbi:hypothetical protein [Sorangium cellulosum]|uniref:Uncharacterized protein n=1 Tax=Sorangium cellulosum So0157-2 TaxID=1254432 RepID=S4Y6G2_SORCE|nr:hypothetical protein [Sorangium cellulosum]AGP40041.1 hypothetical protein SCE1572_39425 [Sorangium cellulosum So0157-2]